MLRNFSRLVIVLGAALLAGAPALHAQSGAPVRGDVDGDGKVTAADARIISDFLVGKPVPAGANVRERGDVNGDGRVTSVDAAIIARAAAGRDVSRFPVGRPVPESALAVIECNTDLGARSLSCATPGATGDGRGDIIGGQNLNVQLIYSPVVVDSVNQTVAFDIRVQNLMKQAMAADSGTGAANANGVRVFFASGPTATLGSGLVTVSNKDGEGIFINGEMQPYFQYSGTALGADGILARQEISSPKNWVLHWDMGVKKFSFILYLSTELKYPAGWIDIEPPVGHVPRPDSVFSDTVVAGRTLQLTAIVRNNRGNVIGGPVTSWDDTNHGFANVDGSGLVTTTAGTNGVDSVTAKQGSARSGTVEIVVTAPSGPNSVITASPDTMQVGDSATITVQVKDGYNHNVTSPGDVVTLTTTLDSLFAGPGSGTTVTAVYDAVSKTYVAKLKGHVAGTATITGTVNGQAIGHTTTVEVTAAAPANIAITGGDGQSALVGGTVSSLSVHVTDQYNNPVPNITVNFAVTGGGGSSNLTAPITNTSGNTTTSVGTNWTLGNGGSPTPAINQLKATAVGGSSPFTTFTAYVPAFVVVDSSQAMGNTTLSSSVAPNVLTNDYTINGGGVTLKPTSIGNLPTVKGGTVTLAANGTFSYLPPAGNVARDSVAYEIQDTHYAGPTGPSGYLKFRFVGRVWYVDNTFGGAADGRDVSPFTGVGAAATAAGANDSILVRTGSGTTTGGTLKAGQLVYGQGASAPFTTTLNGNSVTLLAAGSNPSIGALTLGSGNTLRGFTGVGTITGSGFGTLTVSEVSLNTGATQALSLTTGTLAGGFTSLTSSGGTNNVLLSGVGTTGTSTMGASGNALSGASKNGVAITGGSGSFTFPGNVSNTSVDSFAVNVSGKTGGTVTFSGNINPGGAARGISLSGNSSGSNTIVFSGTTKAISSGTGAGVTLTSNTGATIQFTGGGLAIATTTGTPFTATGGGTVEVTGSGNTISATGNAANAVLLNGITLGANGMTFASISSTGTTTGTTFSATSVGNTSGSSFTATTLMVAGSSTRGIDLTSNSAPFSFNGGSVASTGTEPLFVSGGSADITVAASLTKTTGGRLANIGGHTAGTVTVSGVLSCTSSCTGVLANGNTGGTIAFTNATQTFATGTNAAVSLTSNTGATINFTGGNLAISTTSGAGFSATGGGTVNVTGGNNTIISTALVAGGGNALNVQNTTIGSSNLVFKSINATGGTYGIRLENTGSSGGLQVTGTGSTANSGGTLTLNNVTAADSAALTFTSTANLSLKLMKVSLLVGGASGITGDNLSGTSLIDRSVVDYNSSAPGALHGAFALRVANTSTNGTLTVDGTTFQNGQDGEVALSISAMGTSVMTFNLQDSNTGDSFESKFSNIASGAVVVGCGDDAGSTANCHANISNTKFLNAPSFGINNLGLNAGNSGVLVANVSNNTFDKVGLPLATVGVINISSTGNGRLGSAAEFTTVSSNTITNIRSGAGPTFAYDPAGTNGYVAIRVAMDGTFNNQKVKVLSNQITNVARQGLLISGRNTLNDINVQVNGNTVGTAAAPVGTASGRRAVEIETQTSSVMKVEVTNNNIYGGTTGANSALAIRSGTTTGANATINATVTGNTIGNPAAAGAGRVRVEIPSSGTASTMCLDLRTNTLDNAASTFEVNNTGGGSYKVEGAGVAAVTNANITAANTVGTGSVSGTVNYNNNANCAQPSF